MFDFSSLFGAMEDMFRVDYENHWVTQEDLRANVAQGVLSADGYQRITGEAYEQKQS